MEENVLAGKEDAPAGNEKAQAETEKAPSLAKQLKALRGTVADLSKEVDELRKNTAKAVEQLAQRATQLETLTDKNAQAVEGFAGVVSAASQKAEAVAERLVETQSVVNRINNLVSEIQQPAGTYPAHTVGAVIAKTAGHQLFLYASRLTFSEAETAIKQEKEENPKWEFAFLPTYNFEQ